jgi:hypothetical protein
MAAANKVTPGSTSTGGGTSSTAGDNEVAAHAGKHHLQPKLR